MVNRMVAPAAPGDVISLMPVYWRTSEIMMMTAPTVSIIRDGDVMIFQRRLPKEFFMTSLPSLLHQPVGLLQLLQVVAVDVE